MLQQLEAESSRVASLCRAVQDYKLLSNVHHARRWGGNGFSLKSSCEQRFTAGPALPVGPTRPGPARDHPFKARFRALLLCMAARRATKPSCSDARIASPLQVTRLRTAHGAVVVATRCCARKRGARGPREARAESPRIAGQRLAAGQEERLRRSSAIRRSGDPAIRRCWSAIGRPSLLVRKLRFGQQYNPEPRIHPWGGGEGGRGVAFKD